MISDKDIVNEIKERLLCKIKPIAILQFGSTVKGTNNEHSDIDLLIIWDEMQNSSNIKRRVTLRKIIGIMEKPIDLLTCTTKELEYAMQDTDSFTYRIVKEGEIIYGRLN